MAIVYVVEQGDDGPSLAARHGFASFDKIWDDPDNAALRKLRPNPEVLHPGDAITIPEQKPKFESATEKSLNRFCVTIPKRELKFALRDPSGKPNAGVAYRLEVGAETFEGTTDADGRIVPVWVSAAIPHAVLRTGKGYARRLLFGHVNPLRDTDDHGRSGVAQRLGGLGFHPGSSDGTDEELLAGAILAFQRSRQLTVTATITDELLARLEQEYGC